MDDKNYVVYHLHSDLSNGVTNIDSITKYNEYIDYAASLGMTSMGFAEHGSVFSWVKKKVHIEEMGMKYIHAEEFYITEELYEYPDIPDEIYESMLGMDDEKQQEEIENILEDGKKSIRDNYHCVLIAKNYEGVKELNKLSSIAFNREDGHFYYVPRITMDELLKTSDNIMVTTACLGGVLCKGNEKIQEIMLKFLIKNKHRCFLEIQHHIDKIQIEYNKYLYSISKKYGIPLIAGTDTHALNNKHLIGRSVLQEAKDVKFENESKFDLIFKTYKELVEAYKKQNSLPMDVILEAIDNTNVMASIIEPFKLNYDKKYPKLYSDSMGVFKNKILEGIKWRGIDKYPNFNEYKNKILYELKTFEHNGAIDFMLLEEDYKKSLRSQGVHYGYSRGSVSGSVIAYLLGITDVDSIKFKLNFERFMNADRVSLADIDSDWFKGDRWKVREYLFNKEGLYCSDIITFNTIAMKGAIKDVGRALKMTVEQTQEISDAVEDNEIDQSYRDKYPLLFEYVDIVKGTIVSVGNHPAGAVVSPFPVDEALGIFYSKSDKYPICQCNMKEVDMLNFVKLDILGLDAVGLIDQACKFANIPFLTPDDMDFNDMNVWRDIAKDTTLIFQFESDFAGDYLKSILKDDVVEKIKSVNKNFSYIDLMSMANGAIRPAGESYREELSQGIYRDNGHKALNDFLAPTLGYLVYQCQIIEFLNKFCGFTMGEADIVRRHFSKKTGTEDDIPIIKDGGYMKNSDGTYKKDHYIDGFIKTMKKQYDVSNERAEKLIVNFLKVIISASDYLFSKNHADPYSFLGFAIGYLRHYYPIETFTAALNIYAEDDKKSSSIKEYIKSKGYDINPIKFGYSKSDYFFDKNNNSIYQGLSSIKFCNAQMADELYALSQENTYTDFVSLLFDIKNKTSVNTRQLMILTYLNFFDDFGNNKYISEITDIYEKFGTIKQVKKDKMESLGLSEFVMKKYSSKETAKLYKEIDNEGLMKELCSKIENKPFSVVEQVKAEKEFLNYVVYTNSKVHSSYYIVIEYKTYKNSPTKPILVLHNIKDGHDVKTKIKKGKLFTERPFGEFAIIKIDHFDKTFKKKKTINENGEIRWVSTDETELVLNDYVVITDGEK